jgi:hypothetical protein
MDTLNSNPAEITNTPEAAPVPGTGALEANPSTGGLGAEAPAPAAAPATAPVAAAKVELPKTTGKTVGGWNRFAGYDPNAAKNKQKDGRGGPGGRR